MRTPVTTRRTGGGFTLIELMLVIAIVSLLASILLPSFTRARSQAKLSACMGNLKTIGTAIESYRADYPDNGLIMSWAWLVPKYMACVPTCPSSGVARFNGTFRYFMTTNTRSHVTYNYVVCARGHDDLIRTPVAGIQGPTWSPWNGVKDGMDGCDY